MILPGKSKSIVVSPAATASDSSVEAYFKSEGEERAKSGKAWGSLSGRAGRRRRAGRERGKKRRRLAAFEMRGWAWRGRRPAL